MGSATKLQSFFTLPYSLYGTGSTDIILVSDAGTKGAVSWVSSDAGFRTVLHLQRKTYTVELHNKPD